MARPHKCPVCDGTGKVSRPPHIAGDVPGWTESGGGPYPCHACTGSGIVWELTLDFTNVTIGPAVSDAS